MSSSLRDQLMKAGLVSKQSQHQQRQGRKKSKAAPGRDNPEAQQRAKELAALEAHRKERDRELNEQRNRVRAAQEQAEWVRQLIQAHKVEKKAPGADDPAFHFTLDDKIHHFYVPKDQREKLTAATLGIVWFDGVYQLLPAAQVERIREKVPKRCWMAEKTTAQPASEDDPYAAFQVPDDLMW